MYIHPVEKLQRVTPQTLAMLAALIRLSSGGGEVYGHEVARESGQKPGTIYHAMARLEVMGWVTSRREDVNPHRERMPRRFYTLTDLGRGRALELLDRYPTSDRRAAA